MRTKPVTQAPGLTERHMRDAKETKSLTVLAETESEAADFVSSGLKKAAMRFAVRETWFLQPGIYMVYVTELGRS